jgi:hypothetical protein
MKNLAGDKPLSGCTYRQACIHGCNAATSGMNTASLCI